MKKILALTFLLTAALFVKDNQDCIGLSIGNAELHAKASSGIILRNIATDDTH